MKQKRTNQLRVLHFKRFTRKAYAVFSCVHKVVNIGVVSGCALLCLAGSPVSAQTGSKQSKQPEQQEELDEVTVTASRVEMPVNQAAKMITVITKEQIEQAPVQSLQDLLNYVSSIDVIQRGGHGVQTDISIRGGTADQTAILLNGVNISNPQTGHYSFDIPINLSDIQRIEILHGPSALIYGSSAFSGGINIITNKSDDTPLYTNIETGMYKLRGMQVRGAIKQKTITSTLSVGYNSSEGYIQNTDYDIYNILFQTRITPQNKSKIDILLGYNDKKYGANSFYSAKYPNQFDHTSTYMGSIKGEFGTKLKTIPILYWNRHFDHFQLERGTNFSENFHRSDAYGGNLIFTYQSKLGNTSLGSEVRQEQIISSILGKPMNNPFKKYKQHDRRLNTSIALEHTYYIKKITLSGGLLLNHNTLTKKSIKLYPSLSINYRFADNLSIFSTWSRSVRTPTFTDLYYTTQTHEANSALKPEQSESIDIGVKYDHTIFDVKITTYYMQGRNMIDWVKQSATDKWSSWNHTQLTKQGIDVETKLWLHNLTSILGKKSYIGINYAYLNQTLNSQGLISLYSLNYLRNKVTFQLHHTIYKDFSASWYFCFQERMGQYEEIMNKQSQGYKKFPQFAYIDLKLNYQYHMLKFYLNFNNLTNTYYYNLGNIPQAGFWFTAGINFTIK